MIITFINFIFIDTIICENYYENSISPLLFSFKFTYN